MIVDLAMDLQENLSADWQRVVVRQQCNLIGCMRPSILLMVSVPFRDPFTPLLVVAI